MIAAVVIFWLAAALIVWAQIGYPLAMILAARAAGSARRPADGAPPAPLGTATAAPPPRAPLA